ncbi:membrane-associated phospholipid phosphatase [Crossiella equi]|uniref:Membrane-associated phospholipid phosphatase n=1 Tax=Crossiella equi TaxID=130796 RepID=A0ABS5ALH3_9PSEU|nr:phosphatase PAP2 family protein [Crossiella equi]MBP2477427.1 membrane-associated phospholipid phosphatase [Crossiella equi]
MRQSLPAHGSVPWRIALSVPAFLAAFIAAYLYFVRTPEGQRWENQVLSVWSPGMGNPVEDTTGVLGWLNEVPLLLGAVVGVVLVALVGRRYWAGFAAVGLVGVTVVGAQLLKLSLLTRPRFESARLPTHNSFPSGHVTLAMVLVLALLVVVPARLRVLFAVPGAIWVGWVATATMQVGWHRFSDTLGAGLLAASVCVLVVGALVVFGQARRVDRPLPVAGLLLGWLTAAGAVGWFAVHATSPDAASSDVALAAAQSASLLIVLAVTGLVRSVEFVAPERDDRDELGLPGPLEHQRRVASEEELRHYRRQLVP